MEWLTLQFSHWKGFGQQTSKQNEHIASRAEEVACETSRGTLLDNSGNWETHTAETEIEPETSTTDTSSNSMDSAKIKPKKKKVLLMGKSGSGKSSMRSIIFSNFVAKDVRRLGATIDVEHSRIKFLGNLILNLWDCGGQDAFTENYLTSQKPYVFSDVGVIIYVFDVESREFDGRGGQNFRDLNTYNAVIKALQEFSPDAKVFTMVHKMDLVQSDLRERVLQDKSDAIRERSEGFKETVQIFGTTIWDQTLYKAWGKIVNSLIPNLEIIEWYLKQLAEACEAEEIILFESVTFLTVTSVTSEIGKRNPYKDRQERLSNIIKTFKQSLSTFSGAPASASQFNEYTIKTGRFTMIIMRFTTNTYILVVCPPGESQANCARFNIMTARDEFKKDELEGQGGEEGAAEQGESGQKEDAHPGEEGEPSATAEE